MPKRNSGGLTERLKSLADLATPAGMAGTFVYALVKYPGYISYWAVAALFALGASALALHRLRPPRAKDWRKLVGLSGLVCLLAATAGLGYRLYRAYWGPVVILVSQFNGDGKYDRRLTEQVQGALAAALRDKPGIKLILLDHSLPGLQDVAVREEAGRRDADVAIWGSRWVQDAPELLESLDVHFDVLNPAREDWELKSERIHVEPAEGALKQIDHFNIEADVARDMTYLALITLGVARRTRGDLDGAIAAYTAALENVNRQRQVLHAGESVIKPSSYALLLFQRGVLHLMKRDHDAALTDFLAAAEKDKYVAAAGLVLGGLGGRMDGDSRVTAGYAGALVKVLPEPDNSIGYYLAGSAFMRRALDKDTPEKESKELLIAGLGSLTKAMDLTGSDERFAFLRKEVARELAIPHLTLASMLGRANEAERSDEEFRKAREFAEMSGDAGLTKRIDEMAAAERERRPKGGR